MPKVTSLARCDAQRSGSHLDRDETLSVTSRSRCGPGEGGGGGGAMVRQPGAETCHLECPGAPVGTRVEKRTIKLTFALEAFLLYNGVARFLFEMTC